MAATATAQRWVSLMDAKRQLGISHYLLKKLIAEQDLKIRSGMDSRKKYISIEKLQEAIARLESSS